MQWILILLLGALQGDTEAFDPNTWLDDVEYAISNLERGEFKRLKTDDQRFDFVERFWKRRDPDPSTERNEAREEHYRRLEYVDKHFKDPFIRT